VNLAAIFVRKDYVPHEYYSGQNPSQRAMSEKCTSTTQHTTKRVTRGENEERASQTGSLEGMGT